MRDALEDLGENPLNSVTWCSYTITPHAATV